MHCQGEEMRVNLLYSEIRNSAYLPFFKLTSNPNKFELVSLLTSRTVEGFLQSWIF